VIEDPAMKPLSIEEPTISMFILVNNGPSQARRARP
jgi:predicted membrane GTPase involved in stress response